MTPSGLTGAVLLALLLFLAVFGPLLTPFDFNDQNLDRQFLAPLSRFQDGGLHLFGTDNLGRDVFTRLVVGARISFLVGVVAVGLAFAVGVPLGAPTRGVGMEGPHTDKHFFHTHAGSVKKPSTPRL